MVDVKVLGTGCATCKMLELMVKKAIEKLGIAADVEYVQDINRILEYGLLMTPALVINGEVKVNGRLPSEEKLINLLKNA